jgi:hypothetical protein
VNEFCDPCKLMLLWGCVSYTSAVTTVKLLNDAGNLQVELLLLRYYRRCV